MHCAVCGRRLSIQHSKGRYTYFFCLGQKNDPSGTCRERYVAADDLESQVEDLYQRIELPASWAERLREEMAAEVVERQRADAAQRELLTRRLAKAETQRRKLLDAYYAAAIDVTTLKAEQARIGADIGAAKDRLGDLDANLGEWQEILELAATFATRCADAYAKATDRTRKQFNAAVFERLDVKDGRLCHEAYRPPFDSIFSVSEFEYETRVELMGLEPTTYWMQTSRSSQLSYSPASHSLGAAATRQMIPRSLRADSRTPRACPHRARRAVPARNRRFTGHERGPLALNLSGALHGPRPAVVWMRGCGVAGLRHERPRSTSSSTITVTWATSA